MICGGLYFFFNVRFAPMFARIPHRIYRNVSWFFLLMANKSKAYSDREKKQLAYEALLWKYKEMDSTSTQNTVKKKINFLRSVYRKELLKMKQSHRSGAGTEDLYMP